MAKPSDEIRTLYVQRLAARNIGDGDDADHETCMLARWDALLGWLDDQQENARVEQRITQLPLVGLGLDRLFEGLHGTEPARPSPTTYDLSRAELEHLSFARSEEQLHRRGGEFNAANALREYADRYGRTGVEPDEVEWADRGQIVEGE